MSGQNSFTTEVSPLYPNLGALDRSGVPVDTSLISPHALFAKPAERCGTPKFVPCRLRPKIGVVLFAGEVCRERDGTTMERMGHPPELANLQRHILAILEEAGEENIASIRNTIGENKGTPAELEGLGAALTDLLNRDFIEAAEIRDDSSRRWVPLSKERSLFLLRDLKPLFEWSSADRLWKWRSDRLPRLQILLTHSGSSLARAMLSGNGYPS